MGLTVSRQTAKNLTVNRQKRTIFTVNRQKGTYKLAVKRLQGLSNLTISAAHLGCWLPKNSFKVAQLVFSGGHPPNFEWLILHRKSLDELATSSSYWALMKFFKTVGLSEIGVTIATH